MFAPKWEKELYRALVSHPNFNDLPRIGKEFEKARPLAAFFEATADAIPNGDLARGTELLNWLFSTGYDPTSDDFLQKYLPGGAASVSIAEGITVEIPADHNFIGLALAELHQAAGRIPSAVDIVEQLTPSTVTAISLAELYSVQGRWEEVITLTDGLQNDDEAATYLLIQRGIALREQGFPDASREAFKEALRVRSRPVELRQRALIERGVTYLTEGKRSLARKDFERVLAENSNYPGLREHLAKLEA
ncbi:hypothetical protein M1E17_05925 [Arthrobacter sp. D1-29]